MRDSHKKGRVYIGTSGWIYDHWQGIFYPDDLSQRGKLTYYSSYFKTVEVNYSFYHLPRAKTYQNWYQQTPEDFLFALKTSRFITHIKRLKGVKGAWQEFLARASNLKEKLGPILFQFPSSFKATDENIKRLETFLDLALSEFFTAKVRHQISNVRFAFEFRHQGWCDGAIYKILQKYNAAWVIADSPRYPKAEAITAKFVYIRMHGSKKMFSSSYTIAELRNLAEKIKKWRKQGLDIYCYFNNDFSGFAVKNASKLKQLLGDILQK